MSEIYLKCLIMLYVGKLSIMPFVYRLQKMLEFRIRKKEAQLQEVLKAQMEVYRIEGLIEQNNKEIQDTRYNMAHANPMMYESYDTFLKHLYDKGEELELQKQDAIKKLREEQEKLLICEREVKVLEKHKEKMKEEYIEEEKKIELKRLSEVAVQRHFRKTELTKEEESLIEEISREDNDEYN